MSDVVSLMERVLEVIVHGLKTNIVIRLMVLLVLGMILIDFVLIISSRKLLQDAVRANAQAVLSLIGAANPAPSDTDALEPGSHRAITESIRRHPDITCILVLDENGRVAIAGGDRCDARKILKACVLQAMADGRPVTRHAGITWGVFWKQDRYLIIAQPMGRGSADRAGGVGLVVNMEKIFLRLRQVQAMILIYIVINAGLLAFIGMHGLARVTIHPLKRLVKRADEYSVNDDMHFLYESEANEFSRLSKSLNQMLSRISEDKEKLRTTIRCLEKANTDLRKAQKEIVRAEKSASIGRLSSGLAHEIGNPIGIILGYIELLRQDDLNPSEKNDYLSRAENEIHRINTIVQQLLEFSRQSDADFSTVCVHTVIGKIAEVCKLQPMTAHIRLELNLAAKADSVFADPDQLRQVFLNLIINAADAIASGGRPEEGTLTISTENLAAESADDAPPGERLLEIRLMDNGPGIPAHRLDTIFDPFYTTKEPGKGTGLGLSVSERIIESFGGTLTAESNEGQGATFVIRIPIIDKGKHSQGTPFAALPGT